MFDPDLLKAFVAVAEAGGFTRAASRLNSTQSTVSAQIQRLEAEAGQQLFLRSTRSVALAPAGEILLGYARTILRLNEDARLHLSGGHQAGKLRIGAAEDLAGWLPKILRTFTREFPEVRVEVEIGIGMNLFTMIESAALDLAIGGVCVDHVGNKLWKDSLVWAFAADTTLPDPLPLAFFPEPCPYREAAMRALAATRREWQIACTSSSMAGVRAIAAAGIAVTPLPMHAVTPGLAILGKREELPRLPDVDYVLETNRTDTRPLLKAFSAHCQQAFGLHGNAASATGRSRGSRSPRAGKSARVRKKQ
jgi:DNA-binding transcriptional LysR family regulator